MQRTFLALVTASIVAGAAGCGGGSQDEGPPTDALGSAAREALNNYQQGGDQGAQGSEEQQ